MGDASDPGRPTLENVAALLGVGDMGNEPPSGWGDVRAFIRVILDGKRRWSGDRLDAATEDAVQETLWAAHERIQAGGYDPAKASTLRAWLKGIAYRKAMDVLRQWGKNDRAAEVVGAATDTAASGSVVPNRPLDRPERDVVRRERQAELRRALRDALVSMKHEHRIAVVERLLPHFADMDLWDRLDPLDDGADVPFVANHRLEALPTTKVDDEVPWLTVVDVLANEYSVTITDQACRTAFGRFKKQLLAAMAVQELEVTP